VLEGLNPGQKPSFPIVSHVVTRLAAREPGGASSGSNASSSFSSSSSHPSSS
jgi:hypothetical protein